MTKLPDLYHIGIPKSGTTTIQSLLRKDERLHRIGSHLIGSYKYWEQDFMKECHPDRINIVSNENLVLQSGELGKLSTTLFNIRTLNPNAKILVTIREQRSALVSRYKYNFPYWDGFTLEFEEWLKAPQGLDYIGISLYSALYRTICAFFPKENVHFMLFEDLKEDQDAFIDTFYKLVGVSPIKLTETIHSNRSLSDPELMFLKRINHFKLFRSGNEISKKELEAFKTMARWFRNYDKKYECFKWNDTPFLRALEKNFSASNKELAELGIVSKGKLQKFGYL